MHFCLLKPPSLWHFAHHRFADYSFSKCEGVSTQSLMTMGLTKLYQLLDHAEGLEKLKPFYHYFYHSLAPGQTTGRGHNLAHQQKTGLKIY